MDTHNATQKQEDISRASAFASRRNLLAIAVAGLDGLLGSSAASAAPASRGQSLHEINVKNFGARGDGRTDETAAFQRALDSVHIVVVRFVNSAFWGPCNQIAKTAGRGTIGFRDCTLIQWKKDRAPFKHSPAAS